MPQFASAADVARGRTAFGDPRYDHPSGWQKAGGAALELGKAFVPGLGAGLGVAKQGAKRQFIPGYPTKVKRKGSSGGLTLKDGGGLKSKDGGGLTLKDDQGSTSRRRLPRARLPEPQPMRRSRASTSGNWSRHRPDDREDRRRWAPIILARDGHRCRWCGATEQLQVHHVREPVRSSDDLLALCETCNLRAG